MVSKFEENFWGKGNHGLEVLLGNLKAGITASKELSDYIKERVSVEDGYCKGLAKVQKLVQHVSTTSLGGFAPLWEVLSEMSGQLVDIHGQFVKMLSEVNKEVLEYNAAQREKLKTQMRGEIEQAQESLTTFQGTEAAVQRTKKQYQQSVEHLAKAVAKQEKTADPKLESRMHQAKVWMETMKSDHQTATKKQCEQVMDFQLKMKEACQKFESLEEEHLAQMTTFMTKITRTQNTTHLRTEQVFSKINQQLDIFSVEKLLTELVSSRGTGRDRPVPYKFKALDIPASANVSSDDLSSNSPTNHRTNSKGEKSKKGFLRKKKKQQTVAGETNAPGEPNAPEPVYEVDEEGYSIRPDHSSSIGMFPGQTEDKDSDFDSSDDDEPESRIKKITIREKSMDTQQASVDDIKASMMSIKLSSSPAGMRKTTSSQSLNVLATPPINRHESSTPSNSSAQASLLDIDLILSGGSGLSGIPSPLIPEASLPPPLLAGGNNTDPTKTLTPWNGGDLRPQPASPPPPLIPNPTPAVNTVELAPPSILTPDNTTIKKPPESNNTSPVASVNTSPRHTPNETKSLAQGTKSSEEKILSPLILPPPRRSNTPKKPSVSSPSIVSPLAVSKRSVSESPTPVAPGNKVGPSAIPLAVAFRETCNAIFHGTELSKCVLKVTGEVMISFPSNYLSVLGSSEVLGFKLSNAETVERVLHNQQLLKRQDDDQYQYSFDMAALLSQLKMMKEKHTAPFYNVQLLKYEVKLPDPSQLPVKLVCYWKCETTVTNYRLDYSYLSSVLKTVSGEAKPLTGVSISVPVGGRVKNTLSKPTGKWNDESKKMVWDLQSLPPNQGTNASLHAKFELDEGPSVPASTAFTFECDGATLSGLNFELCSSAYQVSLLKFKCSSGKYVAEVS